MTLMEITGTTREDINWTFKVTVSSSFDRWKSPLSVLVCLKPLMYNRPLNEDVC